jgi:rhodanese-related sulfurtransferase
VDTVALRSAVHFVPYPKAEEAAAHFSARLAYETDCADVWAAIECGAEDFLLADCRPAGNYAKLHIPGAVSLPWRDITAERVGDLPNRPIVTYCWGPSCNAATKGAVRLAQLGRQVKEMIGGLEYWIREGHPTVGKRPIKTGEGKPSDWGLVI